MQRNGYVLWRVCGGIIVFVTVVSLFSSNDSNEEWSDEEYREWQVREEQRQIRESVEQAKIEEEARDRETMNYLRENWDR